MSKRIDITGQIFGDIYVLEFIKNQNTHALYKCLCMVCSTTFEVTYSNIKRGVKSCQSCAQKVTNYKQEFEILDRLKNKDKISDIAKDYGVSRRVIYRIEKECDIDQANIKTKKDHNGRKNQIS